MDIYTGGSVWTGFIILAQSESYGSGYDYASFDITNILPSLDIVMESSVVIIPEPATMALLGIGILLSLYRHFR